MPAWQNPCLPEMYAWRPVLTVSEVFAHIAVANYGIANALIAARTPGAAFSFDNRLEGTSCH